MTRPMVSIVFFAAFLFSFLGCASVGRDDAGLRAGDAAAPTAPAAFADFEWPDGPEFRSAGRLRALGHQGEGGVDPLVEQARLRAHFDAVLDWLEARESASIATARARLEVARGATFGEADRRTVESDLRAARDRQLDVLERYAARGVFPLHPVPGADAEPIFVDANGTACAVGHLMRVDGWGREVEAIRASDNGVYVPDLASGPVLAWVATSGLLVEEAAVIQPGYTPPPGPGADLTALASPGASLSAPGLRIDQFSATRTIREYVLPPGLTEEILADLYPGLSIEEALVALNVPPVQTVAAFPSETLADIRFHALTYYTDDNGGVIESVFGDDYQLPVFFWNAQDAGGFLDFTARSGLLGGLGTVSSEFRFDLTASEPGFGIDAFGFGVDDGAWGSPVSYGPELLVEMEVRSRSGELLAAISNDPDFRSPFDASWGTAFFAPQESVSVLVRGSVPIFAQADAYWNQFRQDFRIVPIPEPSLSLLIAVGLGGLSALRRRPTD